MHVHVSVVLEGQEEVLAVGITASQRRAVDERGTRGEPSLGAADVHGAAAEGARQAARLTVDDMTFGHDR